MPTDLYKRTARELVDLLNAGEIQSIDVVESLIERADAVETRVNALTHTFRDAARSSARMIDDRRRAGEGVGLLAGLPITVKESIDTAKVASTMGLVSRRGAVASAHAVTVQAAVDAGAILWAKTNVPQTLMVPMESVNELYGTTHNPFRRGHGPGGSSGGEGAALASGTSVLGIGTDIGGSIRVPAAFCGVCGIKPTVHRWSNLGSQTALRGQEVIRGQVGPMARSVACLDMFMRAIDPAALSVRDPYVPPVSYDGMDNVDLSKLRIGYYDNDGFLAPAASVRRAVNEAANAVRAQVASVVQFSPPNVDDILWTYFAVMTADGSAALDRLLAQDAVVQPLRTLRRLAKLPDGLRASLGRLMERVGERRVGKLLQVVGEQSVDGFFQLAAERERLRRDEMRVWDAAGVDVMIAPVYATPAAPIGMSHDFTLGFANCSRYNFLDLPAGSVPVTSVQPDEATDARARASGADRLEKRAAAIEKQSTGLPVGVQVVGRPYREDQVLAVMAAIERATASSRPKVPVDPR